MSRRAVPPPYYATPIVPPAIVSGAVPVAHGLYRENVVKAWGNVSITPTLNDSFNLTSVADGGIGIIAITFDRDFANTTYAITGNHLGASGIYVTFSSMAAGTINANTISDAGTATDAAFTFIAIGDQ